MFVGTRRDAKAAHRFFERAVEDPVGRRVAVAFDELALAV